MDRKPPIFSPKTENVVTEVMAFPGLLLSRLPISTSHPAQCVNTLCQPLPYCLSAAYRHVQFSCQFAEFSFLIVLQGQEDLFAFLVRVTPRRYNLSSFREQLILK